MSEWKHLFLTYDDEPEERITVARFSERGKLLEYNEGYLNRFDSEFLEMVSKKTLKSMTLCIYDGINLEEIGGWREMPEWWEKQFARFQNYWGRCLINDFDDENE